MGDTTPKTAQEQAKKIVEQVKAEKPTADNINVDEVAAGIEQQRLEEEGK